MALDARTPGVMTTGGAAPHCVICNAAHVTCGGPHALAHDPLDPEGAPMADSDSTGLEVVEVRPGVRLKLTAKQAEAHRAANAPEQAPEQAEAPEADAAPEVRTAREARNKRRTLKSDG
jgi:hypothetical protein